MPIGGHDGTCPCGLCECPGYRDVLAVADSGVFVALIPQDGEVRLGWARLTRSQQMTAHDPNEAIRAAFTVGATHTLARSFACD